MRLFYLFAILALTISNCKSDSEILNDKSRRLLNVYKNEKLPSYERLYEKVTLQRQSNPALVAVADSLFQSLKKVDGLLDSLCFIVERADSTGERIDIGPKLLVGTPSVKTVSQESFAIFQYSLKCVSDHEKKKHINERLSLLRYLGTPEFDDFYFTKSSSIFILMTLRSLQNNLKKVALISFEDVYLNIK